MEISTELLVADLAQKLRRGLIETHGPNLEADIRAAVVLAQQEELPTIEHVQAIYELEAHKKKHEDALALIADCQAVLASYLPPDGISKDECINQLLGLLDGPRSRAVLPPVDKPQPSA